MRILKAISDEYNEKNLRRMRYELIGNQWTLKQSKKIKKGGSSKGKEKMESEGVEVEGFEVEMREFMSQMSESMKLLHTKIDNMAFRLVVVEKKMRNLSNEVRKGKAPMEESESESESESEEENGKEDNEEEEDKEEEGGRKRRKRERAKGGREG